MFCPWMPPAFRLWAKMMYHKSDTLYEDTMIAAIAAVHSLTVATRNVSDFRVFSVPTFNPFMFNANT